MNRPSFQFYPSAWMADIGLRACSSAARGLWADMMCLMHQGAPYGHLRLEAADGEYFVPDVDALARMTGNKATEVRRWLKELEAKGVAKRDENGTIFSQKMVRDEAQREQWRERQEKSRDQRKSRKTNTRENGHARDKARDVTRNVTEKSRPSLSSSSSSSFPPSEGSLCALDERADEFRPVYWVEENEREEQLVVDKDWLREEIREYSQEIGAVLTDEEYREEKKRLWRLLLRDPRLRALLRKRDGKPSAPSKFKALASLTVSRFLEALDRKAGRNANQARASPNSNPARKERSDNVFREVMRETLEEEEKRGQ